MEARILAGCGSSSMGCSRAPALSATFTCRGRTSAGVASVTPGRTTAGASSRSSYRISILPGDRIGPEITKVTIDALQSLASQEGIAFQFQEKLVGGGAIDARGTRLPDDTLAACKDSDAVLLAAIGGFQWDNNEPHLRPECGLLNLRAGMGVFANLRSAAVLPQVALRTNILYKTVDAVWGIHGQSTMEQPRSHARIVASLDSDAGKADGARKALEQAFQGKNNLAKKWEEEIKKRELSGGDGISGGGGGGGGGGWGGGGGGGGDEEEMGEDFGQDEPWDWEEFGQTLMATFALLILYISITHGPKQLLKKFKLLLRYIRQGFRLRKIPEEYLTAEGSGIPSDDEEEDEDEEDYEDGDEAAADFIRQRRAEGREADVQKDAVDDEAEDDEEDDIPTPPMQQSRREDLLSKRKAEQKEKLLQLLTPKELRQQQEENK